MNMDSIQDAFRATVAKTIRLQPEGVDRYLVYTPFHFDDGDHFVIVLRKDETDNWVITDEGHTCMHMSYTMKPSNLKRGTRNKFIEKALGKYGVQSRDGQLSSRIFEVADAGNILYDFIQCLTSITHVSCLSRERVVSAFMEDFKTFLETAIPKRRGLEFRYRDAEHDPDGKYVVDCRINGKGAPIHVYAINHDGKCRDTTINILQFRNWKAPFFSLAIFENQEKISRSVLARFTDVCDRQFSNLNANQENIRGFLERHIR